MLVQIESDIFELESKIKRLETALWGLSGVPGAYSDDIGEIKGDLKKLKYALYGVFGTPVFTNNDIGKIKQDIDLLKSDAHRHSPY